MIAADVIFGALIGLAGGLTIWGLIRLASRGRAKKPVGPFGPGLAGAAVGLLAAAYVFPGRGAEEAYGRMTPAHTPEAFEREVLAADKPVLVDFYATWCGPCKRLAPVLGELARTYEGRVKFVRIDGDRAGELMQRYEVRGYPTVMLFDRGRPVARWAGPRPRQTYRAALESILQQRDDTEEKQETAMAERTAQVTFKGKPLTLMGREVDVGEKAPDFTAVDGDLEELSLSDYRGKVVFISAVPSLDTAVCSAQTRRINEEAARHADDVVFLTVSMDLPFAQARWCSAASAEAIQTLSDHRDASFGRAFGVLIPELRLLARSLYIVDRDGVLRYEQVVDEMTDEPDYAPALDALKEVVAS